MSAPVLQYATRLRRPWGPVLFRPSLLSLVLLIATAATDVYLRFHHTPWVEIRTQKIDEGAEFALARGGRLVILDEQHGLSICDARTGKILNTLADTVEPFPRVGGSYHPTGFLDEPRLHILVRPKDAPHLLQIHDVLTGNCTRTFSIPDPTSAILDISRDEKRILSSHLNPNDNVPIRRPMTLQTWQLDSNGRADRLLASLDLKEEINLKNRRHACYLSPDGNAVLVHNGRSKLTLRSVDLQPNRESIAGEYPIDVFAFNGKRQLTYCGNAIQAIDTATQQIIWSDPRVNWPYLVISPDEKFIAGVYRHLPYGVLEIVD